MEKIQKTRIVSFIAFFVLCLSILPSIVSAAKINIAPQTGLISAGSEFTVNVSVSSPDQAMNGVSGTVTFPTDLLSVSSVSKFGSIINVWAQDPTFSNANGTVNFEGVVLTPGFVGSAGKVVSITFRAKVPGIANVKFSDGTVLANDGMGTNILNGFGNSQFTITKAAVVIPSIPAIATVTIPTLNPPSIDYYKAKINEGDSIVLKGSSQYQNSKVLVFLQYNNEEPSSYTILTDKIGEFVFAETSGAKAGLYKAWAESLGEDGSVSTSSPTYTILVGSFYNISISQGQINILILVLILAILLYLIRSAFVRRHRTKREFSDIIVNADKLANVKLNNFTKYIDKQIDVLESNQKFSRIGEYEALIENFKESITEYKKNLEKNKNE